MNTKRSDLVAFYSGTPYKRFRAGNPKRPSEWHMPKAVSLWLKDVVRDDFEEHTRGKSIVISLPHDVLQALRTTLLHESLFSYYKAFYNYLAAKNLYLSGAEHWIEITNYYAQFFLARSLNTLIGIQSYRINSDSYDFLPEVFKIVNPNLYGKILRKYDDDPRAVEFDNEHAGYAMHLKSDLSTQDGELVMDNKAINSQDDTWKDYANLDHPNLGVSKLTSEGLLGNEYNHLSKERNQENYSFDGYMQVDFNLPSKNFPMYFGRDSVKTEATLAFDSIVGTTLGVFCEMYQLFNELEVDSLPIEVGKFEHMISYMVIEPTLKEKLLELCRQGFPPENEFVDEMNLFYS